MSELLTLVTFDEGDINKLISEIPDERFLLQWAGPKYIFPLDFSQLKETLTQSTGKNPSSKVLKVINSVTSESVGHVQLLNIDYHSASCVLGRAMIFEDHRGQGFGKVMIMLVVKEAFEKLDMQEITLNVFDFNKGGISVYKDVGFVDSQVIKGARKFQNENWNLISMKLKKDKWLAKEKF